MRRRNEGPGTFDGRRERSAVPVIVAAIIVVAVIVAAAVAWGVLMSTDDDAANGARESSSTSSTDAGKASDSQGTAGKGSASQGTADTDESTANAPSQSDDTTAHALPFTIKGAPADAKPQDLTATGEPATLRDSWTFGGDYANIGSIPVDADTVFGSFSSSPDDVYSYSAALIRKGGPTILEPAPVGQPSTDAYFEPQDGSGDAKRLVWRAASINRTGQSNIDNWQVKTWDAATRKTTLLGSAKAVNGRDDTPSTGDVTTPTANATTAYVSSNVAANGGWTEKVLAFALDGSTGQAGRAVGEGGYPVAVDDGVVYASGPRSGGAAESSSAGGAAARLYGSISHVADAGGAGVAADAKPETVLTVEDKADAWGVCGVQAHGGNRAVAFCNAADDSAGAWIGLWTDGFRTNKAWLHVASPTVTVAMNDNWLVWGSGSQSDDPGMFAYRWADGKTEYLGRAPGYSRPAIASGVDVVMVPVAHGDGQAVSFTVGRLE